MDSAGGTASGLNNFQGWAALEYKSRQEISLSQRPRPTPENFSSSFTNLNKHNDKPCDNKSCANVKR